jgi:hypothetical protein
MNCSGIDPLDCPTLRESVIFANGNTDSGGSQTRNTIVIPAGTYTLTTTGADETFASAIAPVYPAAA